MSKPRFIWWSYVKNMIRQYPDLAEEYAAIHQQVVTSAYSGMPMGGGSVRPMEAVAIRELPKAKQLEYEAVHKAIQATKPYQNARKRLGVVKYVFWDGHKGRRLIAEAAKSVGCSYDTAQEYQRDFILLVASFYGLI